MQAIGGTWTFISLFGMDDNPGKGIMGGTPRTIFSYVGTHKSIDRLRLKFITPTTGETKNFAVMLGNWYTGCITTIQPQRRLAHVHYFCGSGQNISFMIKS